MFGTRDKSELDMAHGTLALDQRLRHSNAQLGFFEMIHPNRL
jgi:hypothetical protein